MQPGVVPLARCLPSRIRCHRIRSRGDCGLVQPDTVHRDAYTSVCHVERTKFASRRLPWRLADRRLID